MTATAALTTDLQRQVLLLEDDLRARLQADAAREGDWKREHQQAMEKERTAAAWVAWRDDRITQAAVAWVLTTVFIRFCEDNSLVAPVWITGPENRRQEALDAQLAYFRTNPEDTDREWLQSAIDYLAGLPATRALVESHSALYLVSPSGDAVTGLLNFWRTRREDGSLVHDLHDSSLSTRFLGDLYQDLSKHAKDTYALLQTPVFVEEFILDRTLEPALNERPLEGFKLIDPTCGSGHFLLGAFARLLDRWNRHAPGLETQARVQAALESIYGVDLNPFAVAIARFRMTVVALEASGSMSLEKAPAFTFHLAVGDALIHGPDPDVLPGMSDRTAYMPFTYATEDGPLLLSILEEGSYDVVVGNPPYITVKDKSLNRIYRSKYARVCKGTYSLAVPFMVQFLALARNRYPAGWVGQITGNSFMKREFGSKLIEDFLAHQDLHLIADTSGAYIPGHGIPTVIIVARNQKPVGSEVRAILGVRGEPQRPKNPGEGVVWTSIINHIEEPGWDDEWITVANLDRALLTTHPWALRGGASIAVLGRLEEAGSRFLGSISELGLALITGEESAYFAGNSRAITDRIEVIKPTADGTNISDWRLEQKTPLVSPYSEDWKLFSETSIPVTIRHLWPLKTTLYERKRFSVSLRDRGCSWYEWREVYPRKLQSQRLIVFPLVTTHNYFYLERMQAPPRHSATALKLPDRAREDDYLALLGVLNSSTACFWLKQHSHNKGSTVDSVGARQTQVAWEDFYEFTGTTLQDFPLTRELPLRRAKILDDLAQELDKSAPSSGFAGGIPSLAKLAGLRAESDRIMARMVAVQEELDWEVYKLYGLIHEDLTYGHDDLPELALGQRAFEIVMARSIESSEDQRAWFTRHRSIPITNIPSSWPMAYRQLVQRRIDLITSNQWIGLLEKPEYKRRWAHEPWEKLQGMALREWLLGRLEDRPFWFDGQGRPSPCSVAQLADEVNRDADMVSVLALWEGRPDVPVTESLVRLLVDEAVPFLAAYRYKETGLRKREAWEETWALQRREDAGEKVGAIPVPPKYTSADFRKNSYWQARGKLDVPKERFILYPDAGRETDSTPLLGWAGWDHAQQALALSLIIGEREKDGWTDERLVPLVAGLAELQPWVDQWHGEVDPDYGVSLAAFCREQLIARAAQVGKTLDELAQWRPKTATRGRRPRKQE